MACFVPYPVTRSRSGLLPQAERRLSLSEMMLGVDLEGS
jgi:hypothetical protein